MTVSRKVCSPTQRLAATACEQAHVWLVVGSWYTCGNNMGCRLPRSLGHLSLPFYVQHQMSTLVPAASAAGLCRAQAQHGEVTLADTLAKAGKASSELAALRAENTELMQVGTPLDPTDNNVLESDALLRPKTVQQP